jgi:hypothetical protein
MFNGSILLVSSITTIKHNWGKPATDPVGYVIPSTSTATKTNTQLLNIPQSITVLTKDFIKDIDAASIGEAVRYVPGVIPHQGESNRDDVVCFMLGCLEPTSLPTISAAATEGANGMRLRSPTCWTLAQPIFVAAKCSIAKIESNTAKMSAQVTPTQRNPTARILTSPPPSQQANRKTASRRT